MYTPEKETACPDQEQAVDEAAAATNRNGKDTKPASMLFAEADRIIATFPAIMTRTSKHKAESRVLRLFLAAMAAAREQAV